MRSPTPPKNSVKLLIEFAEKKGLLTNAQAKEASEKNISNLAEIELLITNNGWMIPTELELLFKKYSRHVWNHSVTQFGKIAVHNKFLSKPVFDEILIQHKINKSTSDIDKEIGEVLISKKLLSRQQVNAIIEIQDRLDEDAQDSFDQISTPNQSEEIIRFKELIHQHEKDKTIQDFKKIFPVKENIAIKFASDELGFLKFIKTRLKGHYEIIEVFHQKSIFLTAMSKDLTSNQTVILKILKPGLHFSLASALTYLEEVIILAETPHKNLAEILDFGFVDCFPYMAHKYIEGESLSAYFQNHDASLKNKLNHFLLICNALEHLHQKLIWHKNLSSGNLIITKDEEPIFLNYGISKTIKTKTSISEYNQKIDLVIEYLNYMSPEEASGKNEETDECSEIYSLGVILYELCASQLPYDIENCDLFLALTKIREELPWPPSIYNNEIQPPLEWIILKSLAKEKAHRYQSVNELKNDLIKFLNGQEVSAKPVVEETDALTIGQLRSKYAFHYRILSGVIVALLVTVAVLAAMPSKDELRDQLLFNRQSKAIQRQKQFVQEQNLSPNIINSIGIKLILIPPGSFEMGSVENEQFRSDDEVLHEVKITDGFYISETEITQKQWEALMKNNPSAFKGENLPVENISWVDTQKFINELNTNTGKRYRLPTEAEWEFACRAGSINALNSDEEGSAFAWDKSNSKEQTHPVKLLKPNAFGLFDMHNNVWEWCQDYYDNYNTEHSINPKGPITGVDKVMRGGSWSNIKASSRSATRRNRKPNYTSNALGFRIVLEIDKAATNK